MSPVGPDARSDPHHDPLELVADMTRTRDRAVVDATLLTALVELLAVEHVRIWRVQGEPGSDCHWTLAGEQRRGDLAAATGDSLPDAARIPVPMALMPLHTRCYRDPRVIQAPASASPGVPGYQQTLLPMAGERGLDGVVELLGPQALGLAQQRAALSVLKIHRNFLSLLDYSERDTLTGLLNRKGFDDTFMKATVLEATRIYGSPEEVDDAERRQGGLRRHWLGVVDIDHFKHINDRFGHLVGDEVLVMFSRIMRNAFRFDDQLYRFGGEEFVVLLTAVDEQGAQDAFDRFRATIASHEFPGIGRVTASVGFSDVRPGDTPQACFDRADKAVYHGKVNGRNQVWSHEVLVARGLIEDSGQVGDVEMF